MLVTRVLLEALLELDGRGTALPRLPGALISCSLVSGLSIFASCPLEKGKQPDEQPWLPEPVSDPKR